MTKLVFGNQKMYMNKENVLSFVDELKKINNKYHVVIFPSYPYLGLYDGVVMFGSQDISINDNGAYTGEVSAAQVRSMGGSHTIIGHSERRKNHHEDSDLLTKKINKALENDLIPVFCIGENLEEYEQNITLDVIYKQISSVYDNLPQVGKIIIAYEPVWAIGTGKTPTSEEIRNTVRQIRDYVLSKYGVNIVILYGGSVNPKNIDELNQIDEVDGYLIGGSSSKIDELEIIIEKCA